MHETERITRRTYALRLTHSKSFANAFEFAGEAARNFLRRFIAHRRRAPFRAKWVRRWSS
jgi:hypothetical protein